MNRTEFSASCRRLQRRNTTESQRGSKAEAANTARREARQPSATYRGTIEEVLRHGGEIPPDAAVEFRFYEPASEDDVEKDVFGGKSLAEIIEEIGTVDGLPADLATNPAYMEGFGAD